MASKAPLDGRAILVVEDELMVSLWLEQVMLDLGCASVTLAATVDQALTVIDSSFFDAATLDVNLDGSESLPVADALAARGVPFAVMTGYSNNSLNGRYGDRIVLTKPVRESELAAALLQIIGSQ